MSAVANASVKASSSSEQDLYQQQSVDALIHGSRPSVCSGQKSHRPRPRECARVKYRAAKLVLGVRLVMLQTGVRAIAREPFPLIFSSFFHRLSL